MATASNLWFPSEAAWYGGQLITQPRQRRTTAEQLWLLDWHPIFTGNCPECGHEYRLTDSLPSRWDCPECDWKDTYTPT
jgi:hypothetical protein